MPRVGIALGSNLGERLANLQAAVGLLDNPAQPGSVLLRAPVYQTAPVDCPDGSPDFFNTVVEIGYDETPAELLKHTQAIELKLGRVRSAGRNAPRIIDIDLLYFGNITLNTGDLQLPHPLLTRRRFVLQPLADIRPDLILPGDHLTISQHLASLLSNEPAPKLVSTEW